VPAGIEIGNSRIKIVAGKPGELRAIAYPVPVRGGPPRGTEIAEAFVAAIGRYRQETGCDLGTEPVVIAMTHQFAFATFRVALRDTVALLRQHLPQARLASASGPCTLGEAAALAETHDGPVQFAAARTPGIRALATLTTRPVDLAVDCGSTSTEIVAIAAGRRGGRLYPADLGSAALVRSADPCANAPTGARADDLDNQSRLIDGRLTWIGLFETPLDYVAREAAGYTVVPRVARMAAVTGYLRLAGPAHAPILPADRVAIAAELAQGVGLDPEILGPDELARIAQALHEQAISAIAGSIGRVLRREFDTDREGLTAGILGIGKAALALPALAAVGLTDVLDLETAAGVPPNFGAAAGLAFLAGTRQAALA
jgi:hypothetical protein